MNTEKTAAEIELDMPGQDALDELLTGAVILAAEPVDYPVTDAIELYLQKNGKKYLVTVEAHEDESSGECPPLRLIKSTEGCS